jgi:glycosyltransferase involved in cell wall biosynthesis
VRLGIVRSRPTAGPRALALDSVDALIVNSVEIQEVWYASRKQGPPVHVVLNGVRARMSEREELRRRLRDEIGVADSTVVVGGAGHIAERKGFDILIRAFHQARVADSHLVIIGDGADRPRLEALAGELGLTTRTHFLGHRVDGAAAIAALDLFVLSSHNEGMANVMLEAMAGGTPVIAADISGVRKAIGATDDRGAAGWIVPAASAEMFAGAIAAAAAAMREDPDRVHAIVEEAAWRATNWFGTARMISDCETILFPEAQ